MTLSTYPQAPADASPWFMHCCHTQDRGPWALPPGGRAAGPELSWEPGLLAAALRGPRGQVGAGRGREMEDRRGAREGGLPGAAADIRASYCCRGQHYARFFPSRRLLSSVWDLCCSSSAATWMVMIDAPRAGVAPPGAHGDAA